MADVYVSAGTGGSSSDLMAGQPTMTVNFDKTVTDYVVKQTLENLREVTRWLVPGAYIPGHLIKGTKLIRYNAFADLPATDPIVQVEGLPPDEEALTIGYAEYGVVQRARVVGLTDVSIAMSTHELISIASERLSFDALATVDRSIAEEIVTNGTGIELTVGGTALTAEDIRRWVADLKNAHVPTFPDGFYIAMIHPDVVYDLQNDTEIGGWIEASKYAAPDRLLTGEIGRMHGVRFIETTVGTGDGAGTFNTVVFGPKYFAFGDLQSLQSYFVPPGGDHSDPASQKALLSYKGMWGATTIEVDEAGGPRFGLAADHAGTIDRS